MEEDERDRDSAAVMVDEAEGHGPIFSIWVAGLGEEEEEKGWGRAVMCLAHDEIK